MRLADVNQSVAVITGIEWVDKLQHFFALGDF